MVCMLLVLATQNPQTGMEWILRMEQTYAQLLSYRDSGVCKCGDEQTTFETAYKAPGKLFFQFTDGRLTDYVRSSGVTGLGDSDAAYQKPTLLAEFYRGEATGQDTLVNGLARFAGTSRFTSMIVPAMLIPGLGGRPFHELSNPVVKGTERVDGHDCVVVDGDFAKLYIGKLDNALYKAVDRDLQEIITYHPVLNPKVADGLFAFKKSAFDPRLPATPR